MDLRGPSLLASVDIRGLDFNVGARVQHTDTQTQTPREKTGAHRTFPVNEAGRLTKSTDDLPVVQLQQREGNELFAFSALPGK